MSNSATILNSIAVAGGTNVSDASALTVNINGGAVFNSTEQAITASVFTQLNTGSLPNGVHYLYVQNLQTSSLIDLSTSNTQTGVFGRLAYNDAITLPVSQSQAYFAKCGASSPSISGTLALIAIEN